MVGKCLGNYPICMALKPPPPGPGSAVESGICSRVRAPGVIRPAAGGRTANSAVRPIHEPLDCRGAPGLPVPPRATAMPTLRVQMARLGVTA